jgi:preprotein translocase subunit SecF
MGRRRAAAWLSAVLILVSAVSLATRGLNWGLEFTGGVLAELTFDGPVALESVRGTLAQAGYGDALVQSFGTASEVLVRLPPVETSDQASQLVQNVLSALREAGHGVELLRPPEFIGSQVGSDLAEQGALAMLFAMIMIFIYVMFRFRWKFAAGALAALVHDVIITVGFFSLMGFTVDLSVLAAVLAVIGYSLNDSVVVYDRIRENFHTIRRGTTFDIVNTSLNQTLSRTIITGLTTLLVLFALLLLAGETLFGFSVALIVGIIIGTYSSIYVGGAAVLFLNVAQTDMLPPKREEVDSMP